MKKTVIKRRKRVPAVGAQGTTTRAGSSAATPERQSPANPPIPMPPTPATATASANPSPSPFDRHGFPQAGTRQPTTALPDPLGLRRDPSLNRSVPLTLNPSSERKKPWWVEDRRETPKSREDIEREAANAQARHSGGREHREREGVSPVFLFQLPNVPSPPPSIMTCAIIVNIHFPFTRPGVAKRAKPHPRVIGARLCVVNSPAPLSSLRTPCSRLHWPSPPFYANPL